MPRQFTLTPPNPQVVYRPLDFLGYPGYHVGDDGSVWTMRYHRASLPWPGYRLHPHSSRKSPYATVHLYNTAGYRAFCVHALVLTAFVGPRPTGMGTRHLDGNPRNNALANLCWGTYRENSADIRRHGRRPSAERHGCAKLTNAHVRLLRRLHATGDYSLKSLMAQFGVSKTTVVEIVARHRWRDLPD